MQEKQKNGKTLAMRAGQRRRDRRCRDVPAGASDVSTHRRMHPQRTDASESQPSFNNDLHVFGNTRTLNKRRTHLIGTSLHRNHFRTFIGIHTKNTRNASRMFPGTPMLLQCTDAPPINGGKTEPCRAHRLGASDRVICVRQVIPDAIFSSAREQPDLPGQKPCPVRGRREGVTAGFPPWRGRP